MLLYEGETDIQMLLQGLVNGVGLKLCHRIPEALCSTDVSIRVGVVWIMLYVIPPKSMPTKPLFRSSPNQGPESKIFRKRQHPGEGTHRAPCKSGRGDIVDKV